MQTQTIERTALSQLVCNEEYARKVLPFMKGDYFQIILKELYLKKYRNIEAREVAKELFNAINDNEIDSNYPVEVNER